MLGANLQRLTTLSHRQLRVNLDYSCHTTPLENKIKSCSPSEDEKLKN